MKDIKIGFIGVGARGLILLRDIILAQGEKVTAVCDIYPDRAENGAYAVTVAKQPKPEVYTDYRKVIEDDNVNTVVIATAWEAHTEIAVAAMKAGKAVAMEIGGAYSLEQCYELVNTYEETGVPFMFLENCCFGRYEMMALNMAQQGLFGEIVHASGGYHHDLREEIANGRENRHYRLKNYLSRNCENYPSHEIGPIARILNLNHGNRMVSLVSVASKASGLKEYIKNNKPNDKFLKGKTFNQADIVTTIIKCANGETITLTLDTTLPRFYSRGFTIRGTKGMYEEATHSVFLDTEEDRSHDLDWRKEKSGNADDYAKNYEHPVWQEYIKEGIKGTHDGTDWLQFKTFFNALREDAPMPIDVYDAASWMAITVLSEMSIAQGGAVVAFPDFTKGKWHIR